jgi:hypothetical protein
MVQDGASRVDLRDAFKAQMALLKDGWCKAYEKMRDDYVLGQQGVPVGAAILSPFRLFSGGYRSER